MGPDTHSTGPVCRRTRSRWHGPFPPHEYGVSCADGFGSYGGIAASCLVSRPLGFLGTFPPGTSCSSKIRGTHGSTAPPDISAAIPSHLAQVLVSSTFSQSSCPPANQPMTLPMGGRSLVLLPSSPPPSSSKYKLNFAGQSPPASHVGPPHLNSQTLHIQAVVIGPRLAAVFGDRVPSDRGKKYDQRRVLQAIPVSELWTTSQLYRLASDSVVCRVSCTPCVLQVLEASRAMVGRPCADSRMGELQRAARTNGRLFIQGNDSDQERVT